jgi:hypothetical protein
MNHTVAAWTVLMVALVAANLPFMNERLLAVGPIRTPKHLGWRLLELIVLCGLTLLIGFGLEGRLGQGQPQGWEFYAAMGCLFLTLAFPGFVWRYLRRQR